MATTGKNQPLDLIKMMRWFRRHCFYNCDRPDFRPRFPMDLLGCPPAMGHSCWDTMDIDVRMNWGLQLAGEMVGFAEFADMEESLRRRVFGYVKADGLCWIPYPDTGDITGIFPKEEPYSFNWTTGMAIAAAAERYRITGDKEMKELALKMVRGLKKLALRKGDAAYFEGGNGWYQDGKWYGCGNEILGNSLGCPTCAATHVAICAEMTGEEEALDFALALARGIVGRVNPNEINGFNPDGTFLVHAHTHAHSAWGVAYAGLLGRDERLVEFGRKVYEFVRGLGTEAGWYPEAIPDKRAYMRPHSEVCTVADMADIATCLARSGRTAYWDHVERTMLNGIRATQFFATLPFEKLYRKTHADKTPEEVEKGLQDVRNMQGGCAALSPLNDQVFETDKSWLLEDLKGKSRRGEADLKLEINGGECCPPSGMRAIHNAWRNTIVSQDDGIFVNLYLARQSEWADVVPPPAFEPGISVKVKKAGDFHVRVPSWVDKSTVTASVGGKKVEAKWQGDYLKFKSAGAGDKLSVDFPKHEETQDLTLGDEPRVENYKVHWSENWIKTVEPAGEHLPMYTGEIEPMPVFPG